LFVRKNPKESAEIATRFLDGLNIADATEGIKWLDWDPRVSICTIEGLVGTGNGMIRTGLLKKDKPFAGDDFSDDPGLKGVPERHREFSADLAPLPKTLAECKGPLD